MTSDTSHEPRSTISEADGVFEMTIPPPPYSTFQKLFLIFFLGWWAFGEWMVLSWVLDGTGDLVTRLMHGFFLLTWTFAGPLAVYAGLWTLTGRERIRIDRTSLTLCRDFVGKTRETRFDRSRLTNLRRLDLAEFRGKLYVGLIGFNDGGIAFDYEGNPVRFGSQLDDAEATWILERLRDRLGR